MELAGDVEKTLVEMSELDGYGTLVRPSCDEKSQDLLLRSKLAIIARLEYLRHVVL
jgi:hypothetical protein